MYVYGCMLLVKSWVCNTQTKELYVQLNVEVKATHYLPNQRKTMDELEGSRALTMVTVISGLW